MKTFIRLLGIAVITLIICTPVESSTKTNSRLIIFVTGGRSDPIGDFNGVAKAGSNWGGGIEHQFGSKWAVGIVVHRVEFKHQDVWYDSWLRLWTYTDWTFIRGDWYVKYNLRKSGVSPFLKTGLGIYSMEGKKTVGSGYQATNWQTTGCSLVPGVGLEYSTKKIIVFIETNYNIVSRKSIGGDVARIRLTQFFDFFFGVGFPIVNLSR